MVSLDFRSARRAMVDSQIRTCGVTRTDIVDALLDVQREHFVPKMYQSVAYMGEHVRIGEDRVLLEPMIFARMLKATEVRAGDVVLDVGCGSGYSSAVLARLAKAVVAIEENEALARVAVDNLAALDNAAVIKGKLVDGNAAQGPYDVILIEGAVASVPKALTDQLAEGGRLVTILGTGNAGRIVVYQRFGDTVSSRSLDYASGPVLPGFREDPAFTF